MDCVPNTPMEDDLDDGQKTPKAGFAAPSLGPVVAALTRKVDMLVMKIDGLSRENSELRVSVHGLHMVNSELSARMDGLNRVNSELRIQQQENLAKIESMERRISQQEELLAEFKHKKEHENAKIELVDNSKSAMWDTATSQLNVQVFTVKSENGGVSIRATHGFPTVPTINNSDQLIYSNHYFEATIDEDYYYKYIRVGLVAHNYPLDDSIGAAGHPFSFAVRNDGYVYQCGKVKASLGSGFYKNDVIGCGVMVIQKTKCAEAVKCAECNKKQCTLFFTKNGQIWGKPFPLPSADVPPTVYPAISLCSWCKVTANFGQQPFKYAIPPAKGLRECGHCKKST